MSGMYDDVSTSDLVYASSIVVNDLREKLAKKRRPGRNDVWPWEWQAVLTCEGLLTALADRLIDTLAGRDAPSPGEAS